MTVWTGRHGAAPRRVTVATPEPCPPEERRCDRLAGRLSETLGVPGDALAVRGELLDDDALLGDPPLLQGVSARLVTRAQWRGHRVRAPVAATEVAVVGGPDAGRTRPLTAGTHTVGRCGADHTVGDPSLSRVHLRLHVGPAGVTVTDLGSENGTLLDDEPLGEPDTPVRLGAVLRLGHTTLTIRPARAQPAPTTAPGDGTLLVWRTAHPLALPPTASVTLPDRPDQPPPRRVPWPAVLIPLPIAGVLAWLFGPHLLLLAVMSPLMLLGTYASDRLGARRSAMLAAQEHALERAACERRRDEHLAAERLWRERSHPDLASVARAATTPSTLLWSRYTTATLVVRLGEGVVESGVTWAEAGSARRLPLPCAPVTLDLRSTAVLTVSGPLALHVADAVIGQLVVLHSPRDLALWTDREVWSQAPHTRVARSAALLADAVQLLGSRRDGTDGHTAPTPAPVVLAIDGTALSGDDLGPLAELARSGAEAGIHIVLTDPPSSPGGGVRVETSATGHAVLSRPGHAPLGFTVNAAGPEWASRIAQALAPLRDPGAEGGGLPERVSLHDALEGSGVEATPRGIVRSWSRADDGARVTLGMTGTGAFGLDLATAGPHVLIGGTTGSGKSELLRTVVASLAAAHPPEDVAVVLIDYKGGSAFAGLEDLPHIVGVVTDLDTALTARALTSLKAEVRRREALFAGCGSSDIVGYRSQCRRSSSDLPHLARLVIVVDEFRALADELPDFVTGLVRIAAVGRSLGIHLVLATQRPAGVVTADMRANLGLRIALRVSDRNDSRDVIESDGAAQLPTSVPGRALVRRGADALVAFQTAVVDPPTALAEVSVEVAWADGTSTMRRYSVGSDTRQDLVQAVLAAAAQQGRRAPTSPWLPPLPDVLRWHPDLPAAAWALRDDPAHQRQDPIELDLATMPHLAVAGAVGSGRTTTLSALLDAALTASGPDTHLYVIADPSGPLGSLPELPHTGAVLDRTDPALVAGFVDRLAAEVRARRGAPAPTTLVVAVDGWDVLAEACDGLDHGALTDRLLATLREGYAVGVRAFITGDRTVLSGRVGRTLTERILLRPADQADLVLAGLPHASAPSRWPPGRAVRVGDQSELQVLLRAPEPRLLDPPVTAPWRMVRLPRRVTADQLDATARGSVAFAVSSDAPDPVTVGDPGRRRVLVLGSPGAGRTEAVALIAAQAVRSGRRVCVIGDPHDPLVQRLECLGATVSRLSWEAYDELVGLRRAHPGLVIVADDVDRHADSPLVPVLSQACELAERDAGLVVVSGDAAALAMRPRGLGAVVARGRVGLVLGAPTALDGDLLGVRLPRIRDVTPGRGWFVADRRVVSVQVACLGQLSPQLRAHSTPRRHL